MAPAALLFGPEPATSFERKQKVAQLIKSYVPNVHIYEDFVANEICVSPSDEEEKILRRAGLRSKTGLKGFRALRKEWRI